MRSLIVLIAAVSLSACAKSNGGDSVSSKVEGLPIEKCQAQAHLINTWVVPNRSDTLDLKADCTGETLLCETQFTWVPDADGVHIQLTVLSGNGGAGCMPQGSYTCEYTAPGYNANDLYINCGAGVIHYGRY